MARGPDRWNSGQMGVRTGWLNRSESSENALISGIHVYSIFTYKFFCPNIE
jgi:hypothetical protein